MRSYCVALLIGVTAASGASAASSFVTVAPPESVSPSSIVYYGTPAAEPAPVMAAVAADLPALNYPMPLPPTPVAAAPAAQASPSVVALGEPAVENFKVAAIAEKKPSGRRPGLAPMVIRGGISGEMFARESSPAPASSSSSQPAPEQASATPPQSAKQQQRRTPQPTPEPAAAPPPPSTLGKMPGVQ